MAKKITDFKNPLQVSSGSIFDVSVWTGGILWVIMFGFIMAMGSNILNAIDRKVPGTQSPNFKPYQQEVKTDNGFVVL